MRITLGNTLPPYPDFVEGIRRAPDRGYTLTPAQTITSLKNALRYIPTECVALPSIQEPIVRATR